MLLSHPPKVLAIGAHPDDIELGAGGLIHKLKRKFGDEAKIDFLILTHGVQHRDPTAAYDFSTRARESLRAAEVLGVKQDRVTLCAFHDCGLHAVGHEIIRTIEGHIKAHGPYDIVLTHSSADTHSDHREAHEASISALRYFIGTVLLYAAPSTKPNGFQPTFFVTLDGEDMAKKDLSLQAHASQRDKAFMKHARTFGIASSWLQFHRADLEFVEPFEVYKSFW